MKTSFGLFVLTLVFGFQSLACGEFDNASYERNQDNLDTVPHTNYAPNLQDAPATSINSTTGKADVFDELRPRLELSNPKIYFRSVDYDELYESTTRIRNLSDEDIYLSEFRIYGSEDFHLVEPRPNATILKPRQSIEVTVGYRPIRELTANGFISIEVNHGDSDLIIIPVHGTAIKHLCPEVVAREFAPSDSGIAEWNSTLEITPNNVVEFRILPNFVFELYDKTLEWTLVTTPSQSTAQLMTSDSQRSATLILDTSGTFAVEFILRNADGRAICAPTLATVIAKARNE